MITLHHLAYSQSFRVLWLLEELGIKYELVKYERDPKTQMAPAAYKAISPLGTAPVITHENLVLSETGAIFDYLLDLHPNDTLRPPAASKHRAQHLFWSHTAQGSVMPLLMIDSVFRMVLKKVPRLLKVILKPVFAKIDENFMQPRLTTLLALAEQALDEADWFGGSTLSSADILMSYPIEAAQLRGYVTDKYPKVLAWLARINQRPAFQSATKIDAKEARVLSL